MKHRSPHKRLSEQISLGLQGLLEKQEADPQSVLICQSVIYDDDYVFTIDDVDYYACKIQKDEEEESGDSEGKLLLFSGDQIQQAKDNADEFKDMLPKTVALVSSAMDIGLDSIREEDELREECEYVESIMLEMFGPWDFFKMFLLSLFK